MSPIELFFYTFEKLFENIEIIQTISLKKGIKSIIKILLNMI